MRRAALTFKYVAPELEIIPHPIQTSDQLLQLNEQSWPLFKVYAAAFTKYTIAWAAYTTLGLPIRD